MAFPYGECSLNVHASPATEVVTGFLASIPWEDTNSSPPCREPACPSPQTRLSRAPIPVMAYSSTIQPNLPDLPPAPQGLCMPSTLPWAPSLCSLHRPVCSSPTSVCTTISHHLGADPVKPSLFPFIWSPGPVTLSTTTQARPALRTCVWAAGVCVHTGVCVQLDKRSPPREDRHRAVSTVLSRMPASEDLMYTRR